MWMFYILVGQKRENQEDEIPDIKEDIKCNFQINCSHKAI